MRGAQGTVFGRNSELSLERSERASVLLGKGDWGRQLLCVSLKSSFQAVLVNGLLRIRCLPGAVPRVLHSQRGLRPGAAAHGQHLHEPAEAPRVPGRGTAAKQAALRHRVRRGLRAELSRHGRGPPSTAKARVSARHLGPAGCPGWTPGSPGSLPRHPSSCIFK